MIPVKRALVRANWNGMLQECEIALENFLAGSLLD